MLYIIFSRDDSTVHSLYCSSSIVRVIKFTRLRYAGHVARMKEGRSSFKVLTGKRHLGRPRRRWKTILECILKK